MGSIIYVAPDSFIDFTDPDWNKFLSERNITANNRINKWADVIYEGICVSDSEVIYRIEYDFKTRTFYILYAEIGMYGGYYIVKSFKNENQEYVFSYNKTGMHIMPELKTILDYLADGNISLGTHEAQGFLYLTNLESFLSKVLGYLENQFYGNEKVRLQIDSEE